MDKKINVSHEEELESGVEIYPVVNGQFRRDLWVDGEFYGSLVFIPGNVTYTVPKDDVLSVGIVSEDYSASVNAAMNGFVEGLEQYCKDHDWASMDL